MPELLALFLTDEERESILMKQARRRPITQQETARLLEHIELLEQLTLLRTPKDKAPAVLQEPNLGRSSQVAPA